METSQGAEKALASLQAYTQPTSPDDIKTTAHAVLAEYYLLRNDLEQAATHIAKANAGEQTTVYVTAITSQIQYLQARQAIKLQDWKTARTLLMQALNGAENTFDIYSLLVEVELQSGKLAEAQSLINNLKEQYPAQDQLVLAQSRLYKLQGKTDKAYQYLLGEWQKTYSPKIAYEIYRQLDPTPEKQAEFLLKWSVQQPYNDKPLGYLALNAQRSGNKPQAINYYAQAVKINPRSANSLNNLAWLYYETGNPLALETARQAYDLAPQKAAILDTYGWILVENGQIEKGKAVLEKALELASPTELEGIQAHLSKTKSS